MRDESLTHKNLSALTGVSETTIKSYRKKFPGFFPLHSRGKPLRFASETAEVCKRIRQCFERDLSVEEIRSVLEKEFSHLRQGEPAAAEPEQNIFPEASGVRTEGDSGHLVQALHQQHQAFDTLIDKCSLLAEAQSETNTRLLKLQESFADFLSLFLAREDLIGRGLETLHKQLANHLEHSESGLHTLAQEIIQGLDALRAAMPLPPEQKSVLVRNSYGDTTRYFFQSGTASSETVASRTTVSPTAPESGEHLQPPQGLLRAPLVVRSETGEYLGIAGRSEGAFV